MTPAHDEAMTREDEYEYVRHRIVLHAGIPKEIIDRWPIEEVYRTADELIAMWQMEVQAGSQSMIAGSSVSKRRRG